MNDTNVNPSAVQTPAAPSRTYKILVVDDEPDARELFLEILSSNPAYVVSSATDGEDALVKAAAEKFDLILLDIVMPKKDGVETLAEIKKDTEKYGNPRVFMLTNIGGDLAIEESLKLGASGYRLKIDTEPSDLLQAVEEELAKVV